MCPSMKNFLLALLANSSPKCNPKTFQAIHNPPPPHREILNYMALSLTLLYANAYKYFNKNQDGCHIVQRDFVFKTCTSDITLQMQHYSNWKYVEMGVRFLR